jgi:hypothetical protein
MVSTQGRVGEPTPQDAEDQVLDRQQDQHIVATERAQNERKHPERRDGYGQDRHRITRRRIEQVEPPRDGVAHERPEQVADQKHARLFAALSIGCELGRDEPVDQPVQHDQRQLQTIVHGGPRATQARKTLGCFG